MGVYPFLNTTKSFWKIQNFNITERMVSLMEWHGFFFLTVYHNAVAVFEFEKTFIFV